MRRILVIDDDETVREEYQLFLEAARYEVVGAGSATEAIELLEQAEWDLVLCDLHLPFAYGSDARLFKVSFEVGLRLAKELSAIVGTGKVMAMSARPNSDLRRLEPYLFPIPVFSKPTRVVDMVSIVRMYMDHSLEQLTLQ